MNILYLKLYLSCPRIPTCLLFETRALFLTPFKIKELTKLLCFSRNSDADFLRHSHAVFLLKQ